MSRRRRRPVRRPFLQPPRIIPAPPATAEPERLVSLNDMLAAGMDPVEADRLMMYGDPRGPKPGGVIRA